MIQREVVTKALSTHGTITIAPNEIVYKDSRRSMKDVEWLTLIAHEQSHVQDYLELGKFGFYIDYGIDVGIHGYRDAPTEDLAYKRDAALNSWLDANKQILTLLSNPFNIESGSQILSYKEGKRFRYEAGIDAEISHYNKTIKYYKNQIFNMSSIKTESKRAKHHMRKQIEYYQSEIIKAQDKIKNLQNEKKELSKIYDGSGG